MNHAITVVVLCLSLVASGCASQSGLEEAEARIDALEQQFEAVAGLKEFADCQQLVRRAEFAMRAIADPLERLSNIVTGRSLNAQAATVRHYHEIVTVNAGDFVEMASQDIPDSCVELMEIGAVRLAYTVAEYERAYGSVMFFLATCKESLSPYGVDCEIE